MCSSGGPSGRERSIEVAKLTLVGTVKALPGKGAELEKKLKSAIATSHGESGCLKFTMHRSLADSDTLVVVERWASKEAWDAHMKSPVVEDLIKTTMPIMVGMPTMELYEMVDVGGDPVKGTI